MPSLKGPVYTYMHETVKAIYWVHGDFLACSHKKLDENSIVVGEDNGPKILEELLGYGSQAVIWKTGIREQDHFHKNSCLLFEIRQKNMYTYPPVPDQP